jgi:hypothetical protein
MIKDFYGRRRFEVRFEKRYENYGQLGKPCPARPVSTVLTFLTKASYYWHYLAEEMLNLDQESSLI